MPIIGYFTKESLHSIFGLIAKRYEIDVVQTAVILTANSGNVIQRETPKFSSAT